MARAGCPEGWGFAPAFGIRLVTDAGRQRSAHCSKSFVPRGYRDRSDRNDSQLSTDAQRASARPDRTQPPHKAAPPVRALLCPGPHRNDSNREPGDAVRYLASWLVPIGFLRCCVRSRAGEWWNRRGAPNTTTQVCGGKRMRADSPRPLGLACSPRHLRLCRKFKAGVGPSILWP